VAKTLNALKSLSENDRRSVEMLANAIVNKLLHEPMVFLKNSASQDSAPFKLAVVRQLFGLDKESSEQ
jgi:glutamyl-tRNA reductase